MAAAIVAAAFGIGMLSLSGCDAPARASTLATATATAPRARPTPDPYVRAVRTYTEWLDDAALTWVLTGVGRVDAGSDDGFLQAGSRVSLVPGAKQGSHVTRSSYEKTYAAATLVSTVIGSSPPNKGVQFWILEADLGPN